MPCFASQKKEKKRKRSADCSALQDPCSVISAGPETAWEPVSLKCLGMYKRMRRDGEEGEVLVGGIIFQVQSVGKRSVGGGGLRRKGRSEWGPTEPFLI